MLLDCVTNISELELGFLVNFFEPTCHRGGHKRDGLHGSADDRDLVEAEPDVEHLKGHEGPRQHGTWKKFNRSLSFFVVLVCHWLVQDGLDQHY